MHDEELQQVIGALQEMYGRFQEPQIAAAPHLSSEDKAAFKRLVLEAKSMLDTDLGRLNDFSVPLLRMSTLPSFGMLSPPSLEQLQETVGIIEGGLNQIRRTQNRPASRVATQQTTPYVALSRIAELQTLKNPKFDPCRLIRMLQELNQAHEYEMHIAAAMLVRAITDHVPPVFSQKNFADVAAHHAAGSTDGRSFKGSISPLRESMKHVADGLLHVHIRARETLPSSAQVDYRQSLDVLLGEVARLLRK